MAGKSSFDPSLLELFTAELDVHLPALTEGLLVLDKEPGATGQLSSLMRAAHSIKGAARIVGLDTTVELTHALEDCFVAAQENSIRFTSDSVDVLLRSLDLLPRVAQPEVDPGDLVLVADIVKELKAIKEGRSAAPAPAVPAPAVPPPGTPSPPPPATPPPAETPDPFAAAVATTGNDAAAETILQIPVHLDATSAEQLRLRLVALLRRRVPMIQLDFRAVAHVDPTGLALLAGAARQARSGPEPTTLEISNAPNSVRQLLQQTRLDLILTVR